MRYIGIDIGDGESAVSVLEDLSVIEPVIQTIDGRGSILSVVGMSGTDILIGEKALLDRKVVHLRSRFKSRYLSALESERDIERFVHGIKLAITRDAEDFFDGDFYIAVGCPAGWKDADRRRYLEIMNKAGLENAHIVSESRAAFFYARYAHELKVAPEMLNKTTLVIDIGSSTTDFAYIINGKESSIGTFGDVSLGGGLIEAYMLKKAVGESARRDELESVFAQSSSWKNRCEIAARRLKEQYFLSEEEWAKTPCVATETVYYDVPVKVRFELNERAMRDILSTPMSELAGATFTECLSDLLRHAANATKDNPPKLIILTGGASRMRFFREACISAFPGAQTVTCPNPEYSIAKGLAYAARIDDRLEAFASDVQAYLNSGEIARIITESLDWLTMPLSTILSGRIVHDVVLGVLEDWRSGEIDTIEHIEKPIVERTAELLKNMNSIPEVRPAVAEWCKRIYHRMQPRIDDICRTHDIDRASMSLAKLSFTSGPKKVNILLESPMLSGIAYVVTGALSAALCGGGGVALLSALGGVGSVIVGAVIGLAIAFVGKKAAVAAISRANLPILTRKLLCIAYKRSLSSPRQRKMVEKALTETMSKPEFLKKLEEDVRGAMEAQIMEMARSVEMPIVQ